MNLYAVPYALWIGDEGYPMPQVMIVEANTKDEAIWKAYEALKIIGLTGDDLQYKTNTVWYFDDETKLDESDEEGYIINEPIRIK